MSGLSRQLFEIDNLCAPIPFAERMAVVDITQYLACQISKGCTIELSQIVVCLDAPMHILHACLDETRMLKLRAAL